MDLTPVQFKFKYNTTYFIFVTLALTALTIGILLMLWSLLHGFSWQRAISAFIFALLLSSLFNDMPKTLTANYDGISIRKFIGCARFSVSDILDIREPEEKTFKVTFIGAGYRTSENKRPILSTYVTKKTDILLLDVKFYHSQLRYAISCPDPETKQKMLNYMQQIRQGREPQNAVAEKA